MGELEHNQGHRDLWAALNGQKAASQRIELALARVETKLDERCGLCAKTQYEHGEAIKGLKVEQAQQKGGRSMLVAVSAALLAIVSAVAQVFK